MLELCIDQLSNVLDYLMPCNLTQPWTIFKKMLINVYRILTSVLHNVTENFTKPHTVQ